MKATVTSPYQDRITGEVHLKGDEVELTAERARELEGGGFVRPRRPPARKTARKTPARES